MLRAAVIRFERGGWQIVQSGEEFYIYYQAYGELPKLMLITKGIDTFSAMAEACTAMYACLHPEVEWDDNLLEAVESALNK